MSERFEKVKILGEGATSVVWHVIDAKTRRSLVLKQLKSSVSADSEGMRRAQNEVALLSKLKHPKVVRLVEFDLGAASPYLLFEYEPVETLSNLQWRLPFVLPELSLSIADQILEGLEAIHAMGVIHRDLKPSNVLVTLDGDIRIADFGVSRGKFEDSITTTGALLGSPEYMSPEQARGSAIDERSDLFSVGAILYCLVTSLAPFRRETPMATLLALQAGEVESPLRRNPKVTSELSALILKAMDPDPAKRFSSATEFRGAIRSYFTSMGITGEELKLGAFLKDAGSFVARIQQRMADHLVKDCERQASIGAMGEARSSFERLATVHPMHPRARALFEIVAEQGFSFKAFLLKWKWAFVLSLFLIIGAIAAIWRDRGVPEESAVISQVQKDQTTEVSAEIKQSQASTPKLESTSPLSVPSPTLSPLPPTTRKVARNSSVGSEKLQSVLFDVPPDIEVFWEGQKLSNPKSMKVKPGTYRLELRKPGFAPIKQQIRVKPTEPAVIKVGR